MPAVALSELFMLIHDGLIASQWPGRAYDNDNLIKASISVDVLLARYRRR